VWGGRNQAQAYQHEGNAEVTMVEVNDERDPVVEGAQGGPSRCNGL
jgi:hypothetical protein